MLTELWVTSKGFEINSLPEARFRIPSYILVNRPGTKLLWIIHFSSIQSECPGERSLGISWVFSRKKRTCALGGAKLSSCQYIFFNSSVQYIGLKTFIYHTSPLPLSIKIITFPYLSSLNPVPGYPEYSYSHGP
jgi:hypothetical protein